MVAAAVGTITETTIDVDGVEVFLRRTEGEGAPVVFSHGNPTHSADWIPFLERLELPAVALDYPGWGRSARPSARKFDYSMYGLSRFFGRALDALGIERYSLVVHDWGGLALLEAFRRPERVERLVIMNTVPFLPGYRWHWIARYFWRVPVAGELFNVLATKSAFRLISRQSNHTPGPMPPEFIDMVWSQWRRGFNRPVLELYRSGDPEAFAAEGVKLSVLTCPALVAWAGRDPYIPARFGRMFAERLPDARLIELDDAGHWPWIDRPDLVDRVTEFLQEDGG